MCYKWFASYKRSVKDNKMTHLLHIDSSIQGDLSVTRALSARAAARWRQAHPDGTVAYRDLAVDPVPHLTAGAGAARRIPEEERTPAQSESVALSVELIEEIKRADTLLLGLPVYNFGPPSSVKAWVDHLILPGVSITPDASEGLLGDTEFVVLHARGGGYLEGTPREGWDHAEPWLPHAVSLTALAPRFITAELTLAETVPAMFDLKSLAADSLAHAQAEIDGLWSEVPTDQPTGDGSLVR
jgi:FMN-dependent NADH-azoreductase